MPKKDVTLKTKLTRDEVVELLSVYQIMDDICDDFQEMFDTDLAKIRKLQDKAHDLKHMFDFRPRTGEEGNPNHWADYVMPDDDRAWYHVPKDE
jgi:hypothetical protein